MFSPLSSLLQRLRRVPAPPSALPFRERAAARALACFGGLVTDLPELVNVAGLSIAMEPRLVLHRISPGASALVHQTDLHSLPGEPPRLLRDGWLMEARVLHEPLFGRTVCLGGYPLGDAIFLVGLDYPDGAWVARWVPHWGEADLQAGLPEPDASPLIDDHDAHHKWAREAARFALVMGLHLDAEGTPLEATEERAPQGAKHPASPPHTAAGEWVVRRVHLTRLFAPRRNEPAAATGDAITGTGRLMHLAGVRGHLKRQPYGPGAAMRRWIWVSSYEARRWVAPRPLRVEVLP